jgi:hypothetical protein
MRLGQSLPQQISDTVRIEISAEEIHDDLHRLSLFGDVIFIDRHQAVQSRRIQRLAPDNLAVSSERNRFVDASGLLEPVRPEQKRGRNDAVRRIQQVELKIFRTDLQPVWFNDA